MLDLRDNLQGISVLVFPSLELTIHFWNKARSTCGINNKHILQENLEVIS
jgi:hypothetical protein